jgi:phosphoglycolate phosphatase
MSRPAAILFDWDNTLVDSWGCIQQAMNTTLIAMGHPTWDMAETQRRVALSMKDAFPTLFRDRWQEARDIFYRTFASIHLDMLKPLPGAENTLKRLREAGIPLAVVSNKTGPFIRREAEFLSWTPFFSRLVGAGDAAADKPSELPVLLALDTIGVTASEDIWFVGDASVDMKCARNAGLAPILMRQENAVGEDVSAYRPRAEFQSWSAFDQYLNEILVP